MMNKKVLASIFIGLLLMISVGHSHAQKILSDEISMIVPRSVITHMIKAALPLNLEKGPYLKGALWIHAIDDLKIGPNTVAFDLNIRGKNIKFETQLGKQALLMDIGNLNADFACQVSLRYDAPHRLLYITPYLQQKPKDNKEKNTAANLLQLLSLANGTEYAFEIEKFQPVITQISGDSFHINMEITHIYTENEKIVISGQPTLKKIAP